MPSPAEGLINMSQWRTVVRNELKRWIAENDRREVTLEELQEDLLPVLEAEFPNNENISAGLRRTLQELRDQDEIEFLGNGNYRLLLDTNHNMSDMFATALREYPEARTNGDFNHESAELITDEIPDALRDLLSFNHLEVKGSVGYGGLANIPWIGVFDERITSDPKNGLYIVYLFDTVRNSVFLSFNQGMTELQDNFGRSDAREILIDRAEILRSVVNVSDFEEDEIPLTDDLLTAKNNLYGIASICHKEYSAEEHTPSRTWVNDLSRLVGEFQNLIDEGYYEDLLDAFDEDSGEQKDPFGMGPAGEYKGAEEATSDVLRRFSELGGAEIGQFKSKISKSIVEAWTEPLKNISVQTASKLTADEAILVTQIKNVFDEHKGWLSERSSELGIGTLYDLEPSEVLYMALLRNIQSENPSISRVNVDYEKLKTVLNDEYSVVTQEGNDSQEIQHSLLSYLDDNKGDIAVYTFTAPPDYWLTSLRYRAVSFEADNQNRWENMSEGDLAFFHSRAEPGNPEIQSQDAGFIGVGIIGKSFTNSEDWWWDENQGDQLFPYIVGFKRLFLTNSLSSIDESSTISEETNEQIQTNISNITTRLLSFGEANQRCEEETGRGLAAEGSFNTFRGEDGGLEYERPRVLLEELAPLLTEISPVNIFQDIFPKFSQDLLDGLYFPNEQGKEIIDEIEAAIRSGKHVILTGPPGTGKTEIAEQVVEELSRSHPYLYTGSEVTTATADWSTFDTVGGYMPTESDDASKGDSLSFTPGTVLNRLQDRNWDVPINEPLVIDELNRADIDKAFGQLFTVLSGQSVTLPYTKSGAEVEILDVSDLDGIPQQNQYTIPKSWRLFATMNTYDKTSLYEMSYAFMRRFAFVRVAAPNLETDLLPLMKEYVSVWEDGADSLEITLDVDELEAVGQVWKTTNTAVESRSIGPAIVRDLVLFIDNHDDLGLSSRLTRAVISYVFPQLEGVPKRQEIVKNIAELDGIINSDQLKEAGREMLQITFEEE